MIPTKTQLRRPALKTGLIYVSRSDGFFVGRRERGLLFQQDLAAAVIPLLKGRYTPPEIALLLDQGVNLVMEIIESLESFGLLDQETPSSSGNENWPELQITTHHSGVIDGGQAALLARSRARIDIYGCGLIGANIARSLAAGGVGELRLSDQRSITSQHLPVSSLSSVGQNAARDLERSLSRDYPRVTARKIKQPALVIITRPPAPSEILAWMNFSVSHLLIESRGDAIEIGPLVVPGKNSCLRCLTLDRLDRDPNWYTVELCGQTDHEPPAALAQVAAGLGALAALSLLDDPDPRAHSRLADTTLRIEASLSISSAARKRHPRCGCSWNLGGRDENEAENR
ncbi:MAG TPA: hypothetical protein VMV52_04755 [Candidatus Nanopelagicaceae bacterium]|nr:hypothetical protein [Candidatus Nanopelagicaceae bacterium]